MGCLRLRKQRQQAANSNTLDFTGRCKPPHHVNIQDVAHNAAKETVKSSGLPVPGPQVHEQRAHEAPDKHQKLVQAQVVNAKPLALHGAHKHLEVQQSNLHDSPLSYNTNFTLLSCTMPLPRKHTVYRAAPFTEHILNTQALALDASGAGWISSPMVHLFLSHTCTCAKGEQCEEPHLALKLQQDARQLLRQLLLQQPPMTLTAHSK